MSDRETYAKTRAGYGPDDTPCRPVRSSYTDDSVGQGAYLTALMKWRLYADLMGLEP